MATKPAAPVGSARRIRRRARTPGCSGPAPHPRPTTPTCVVSPTRNVRPAIATLPAGVGSRIACPICVAAPVRIARPSAPRITRAVCARWAARSARAVCVACPSTARFKRAGCAASAGRGALPVNPGSPARVGRPARPAPGAGVRLFGGGGEAGLCVRWGRSRRRRRCRRRSRPRRGPALLARCRAPRVRPRCAVRAVRCRSRPRPRPGGAECARRGRTIRRSARGVRVCCARSLPAAGRRRALPIGLAFVA